MIITIDTEEIAQKMLSMNPEWTIKQFKEMNVDGWSNELIETTPKLEELVWAECEAILAKRLANFRVELIRRFARKDQQDHDLANSLEWLDQGLKQVTTQEAFELARQGKEVFQIYADGTDSMLDDLETEGEYYPDKTKNFPEIKTIFVIEDKEEALTK